ncbi:hypothetical protein POM88_005446 [Heracleum sosnowskyi]|uniref:Uncharacterized protein n=1 Tax=Heracleum sosnowskyi TaxID=360622 RepID=A0AAD8N5K1_9APIA|nr:hypothetical protein POM88_005446 [Heracleum sosnowskyi]
MRKYVVPPKEKCIWCGKLFYVLMRLDQKKFVVRNMLLELISSRKKGSARMLELMLQSVDGEKKESLKKGKRFNKDKTFEAGSSTNDSEGAEKDHVKEIVICTL